MSRPYDNRPVGHPRGAAGPVNLDVVRGLATLAPHGRLAQLIYDHDTTEAPNA